MALTLRASQADPRKVSRHGKSNKAASRSRPSTLARNVVARTSSANTPFATTETTGRPTCIYRTLTDVRRHDNRDWVDVRLLGRTERARLGGRRGGDVFSIGGGACRRRNPGEPNCLRWRLVDTRRAGQDAQQTGRGKGVCPSCGAKGPCPRIGYE